MHAVVPAGRICRAATALAVLAGVFSAGCGRPSPPPASAPPSASATPVTSTTPAAAGPDATVMAYYQALSQRQFDLADSYLAPATRQQMAGEVDSPATNLLTLTNISVPTSRLVDERLVPGIPSPGDYDAFAQVTARYDATFRQKISEADGTLLRFLYLGRLRQSGTWQILAIGSGP